MAQEEDEWKDGKMNKAKLKRDPITGEMICGPCWNMTHWHHSDKKLSPVVVIWDCIGPPCQCLCRRLFEEQPKKRRRVKPDYTNQEVFNGFESDQPARGHKDEG